MQLTVPTIFTAVDKMSAIFSKMGSGVSSFAEKAEKAAARGNRAFHKFTPTISETGHKFIELGEEAISAAAIFEGLKFSGESLVEFDKAMSSLRVKLSSLSDKDFSKFQSKILEVAFDTKESSVEVAEGFEKIISLNRKFAETADGLGKVTTASIILSKVAKTDVATSAGNLVGVMNQFNLKAEESDRVINVLTASQTKSTSSIADTAAGLTSFGTIAKHYNISLEQSVGLLDLLAEKQIVGGEAGSALRMTIIKLQAAHAGYKSGIFNLSDALEQVKGRLDKFRTAKERDNFVAGLFGKRQQATGILLLENLDKIKQYTKGVTGTTEAERLAEISENNLGSRLTQLKNKWVDLLTSQSKAGDGLNILKGIIVFVTDHLGTIVTIGAAVLGFFLAWKGLLIGTEIALGIYNIALGIMGAVTGVASIAIGESAIALGAYKIALAISTAAQWLFNLALDANPIGLVILAIAAIIAIIMNWSSITKWFSKIWTSFTGWIGKAWDSLVATFSKFSFKNMFMEIGKSIFDFLLLPLRAVLMLASKLPGVLGDNAKGALGMIDKVSASMDVDHHIDQKPALAPPLVTAQLQAQQAQQTGLNHNLNINLNDPGSMVKSTQVSGSFQIPVKVSNTQGQK